MKARWLLFLLVAGSGHAGAQTAIDSFTATYRIERSVFDVGRVELDFRRQAGGRYLYRSVTEVAGFIAWFSDERVEESSRGRLESDGIRPERYRFVRTGGRRDRQVEIDFDHDRGKVVNRVNGRPWEMAVPADTLDKLVVQIAMMNNLNEEVADQHFRVADGGRLKDFRISIRAREAVTTPAGRFHAVKVEKEPEPGGRKTFLWLAPRLGYLPVQIMRIEENGATYTSRLEVASESLRETPRGRPAP